MEEIESYTCRTSPPRTSALLTLTGPPFAKVDDDVTFAVSTGASAFCSQGETYKWYKTGADDNNYTLIPLQTASSLTTPFSPTGTYKVKVEVTNRYTTAPVEKDTTIVIIAAGVPPTPYLDANYAVTGDFCYDVKGPKPSSQTQAFYDSRMDGFAGGLTKNYTFTYTNDFRDLTVLNPGGIVASVTQPAVTYATGSGSVSFTVTFVSDVKDRVIANNAPVQLQLLVSYKNNSGDTKVAYKSIKVQDAECGCPAKISATQWLTFLCHNLGADYDIRSDADLMGITSSNFREYHGDWYKFGASTASLENTLTNDSYSNPAEWQAKDFQNDSQDWTISRNPCPSGWRLPTLAKWSAVINTNNNAQKHYVDGVVITGSNGWNDGNINNVLKLGDYLYLPAAGSRDMGGALTARGRQGLYWSSNGSNPQYLSFNKNAPAVYSATNNLNRHEGFSVRCVATE
ncbi:MAG: hypothetical protein LBP72_00595 [Dysgonamonadaceae bacterium]|nr:hypothetical protein [Dysgonamonadaceae bacterium]